MQYQQLIKPSRAESIYILCVPYLLSFVSFGVTNISFSLGGILAQVWVSNTHPDTPAQSGLFHNIVEERSLPVRLTSSGSEIHALPLGLSISCWLRPLPDMTGRAVDITLHRPGRQPRPCSWMPGIQKPYIDQPEECAQQVGAKIQ